MVIEDSIFLGMWSDVAKVGFFFFLSLSLKLCMVSLSLFKTLLSLNCEDLMLQLVLRYFVCLGVGLNLQSRKQTENKL